MALDPVSDDSLADRVAGRIRDAIHEGRYPPGERLVERRLAAELGVSHIPIREALARLTDEGLVERVPRRGARVATLTPRELEELSSLRTVLERFVVTRVQERLTAEEESKLRRMVVSMRRAAARGDYRRVLDLDQRFHERLWELADHQMLGEVVTGLRGRIGAFLRAATAALEPEASNGTPPLTTSCWTRSSAVTPGRLRGDEPPHRAGHRTAARHAGPGGSG